MHRLRAIAALLTAGALFMAAANVMAGPLAPAAEPAQPTVVGAQATEAPSNKPDKTPGAKATEKAIQRATDKTPGAKATEKAIERATQGRGQPPGKKAVYLGHVTAAGGGSLTVKLASGETLTFAVTDRTKFKVPKLGQGASLADIQTGMRVMVQAAPGEGEALAALRVHTVPGKPQKMHRVGTVTAYAAGVSLTIEDKAGNTAVFRLTPDTKILPAERADLLAVGARVTVIAPRDVTGGEPTARGVVVHAPEGEAGDTPRPTKVPKADRTPEPTATP